MLRTSVSLRLCHLLEFDEMNMAAATVVVAVMVVDLKENREVA